jgi:hypothetical protein
VKDKYGRVVRARDLLAAYDADPEGTIFRGDNNTLLLPLSD